MMKRGCFQAMCKKISQSSNTLTYLHLKGETMNPSQYHTFVRTVALVDIPAALFLVACAWIGWPIALNQHVLFFWLGLIAFSSITAIGIARLAVKNFITARNEIWESQLYHEQQLQSISPYPEVEDQHTNVLDEDMLSQPSQSGVPLPAGVPVSQSVPHVPSTLDDFNVTVAYYLSRYPHASIREVERATNIPKSTIGRTKAWQNRVR